LGPLDVLAKMFRISKSTNQVKGRTQPQVPSPKNMPKYAGKLDEALAQFQTTIGLSDDFNHGIINIHGKRAVFLYVSTVCDQQIIDQTLHALHEHQYPRRRMADFPKYLAESVIPSRANLLTTTMFEIRESLTSGSMVILFDNISSVIVVKAKSIEHRVPEAPQLEASSRGSQISFVESIDTNIGLLRIGLNTDTLLVKKFKVGYRSRREVAVIYLSDVANPVIHETVIERIQAIHVDLISQSSAIEQRIIDHPWTIVPLTRVTQRVDNSIREVNQGKVLILVDGDPSAMLVPASIQDFFQTEEDYSHTVWEATFIRWLRIISFTFALFLPALYIAFVDFNPELLPKVLGLQIARSREGVPFPAVMEVCIMQIVVEILREATLRMPKQMGQTIGIVGGLVVGEASVQAGLVSNILIIVVALTAISIFVTPSYQFATVLRLCSWIMVFSATVFGLYGVVLATLLLLYEAANLKSFGMSFLSPFNGEHTRDSFIDGILRLPVTVMDKRTSHLHPIDDIGENDYHNPVHHPQLEKAATTRQTKGRKR